MNKELEIQLQKCIDSLSKKIDNNDPKCWLQWFTCISSFQESNYISALEQSLNLLTNSFFQKLSPLLQIVILCLDHLEKVNDKDYWGYKLLKAASITEWEQSLVKLVLDKCNFDAVLIEATDDLRKCQTFYYRGESLINIGKLKEALLFFEQSTSFEVLCVERTFAQKRIEYFEKLEKNGKLDERFSFIIHNRFIPVAETKNDFDIWMRKGSGEKLLSSIFQLLEGDKSHDISLLADSHRLNTWSIVAQKIASIKSEIDQSKLDADSAWLPQKVRFILADAFKEIFFEQIKSVSLVHDYSCVEDFLLIKGSDLLLFAKLPNYKEVKNKLKSNKEINPNSEKYFVSHRWFASDQPDPTGIILNLLKKNIVPVAYYWIDYSCMPQKPRTDVEHRLFREHLKWLPSLFFNLNTIIVRCQDDGYFNRAWCFFEILAASVVGKKTSYIYEDETMFENNQNNERKVLEQTLLNMDLPESMATTEQEDKGIVQVLVQNVAFLFKLRVVEHYLALGQVISNQWLFFGEDPYYFVAICDFSKVLLWLFDRAKELGMQLKDLSLDTYSENFLVKMAQNENFVIDINTYGIPKKVALNLSTSIWFYDNRFRTDNTFKLFYKLTTMIE